MRPLLKPLLPALAALFFAQPAHACLSMGENASWVLGQPIYTSNSFTSNSQSDLQATTGVQLDPVNHRLFVTDSNDSRIMVFNLNTDNSIASNGMNASNVIGQSNFTNDLGGAVQNEFKVPYGAAFDPTNNRLFVPDGTDNRVMVFNTATITNGMNASNVLGQLSFTTTASATTQSGLSSPECAIYDNNNDRLFVSDTGNNRVMVFNVNPTDITSNLALWWKLTDGSGTHTADSSGDGYTGTFSGSSTWATTGPNAGGLTFTHSAGDWVGSSTETAFNQVPFTASFWINFSALPSACCSSPNGGETLMGGSINTNPFVAWSFFAGSSNNVIGFSVWDTSSGEHNIAATGAVVAGQWYHVAATLDASYNMKLYINGVQQTSTANSGSIISAATFVNISASTAGGTVSGTMDDVRFYNTLLTPQQIANIYAAGYYANNLIYGESAQNVLGQTGFTTGTAAVASQSKLKAPRCGTYDTVNDRLFVADMGNNRVLAYNAAPGSISNGMNASNVLGQLNYTTTSSSGSQSKMNTPQGIGYDYMNNRLFVADTLNNRVLAFNALPGTISNGMNASYALGVTSFVSGASSSTTQSTLWQPNALWFSPENSLLYVSDFDNNRVMVFDTSYCGGTPTTWTPGYE